MISFDIFIFLRRFFFFSHKQRIDLFRFVLELLHSAYYATNPQKKQNKQK